MSKTTKPTVLDLVDEMDLALLYEETLINALISCEAFNGSANIDRSAFLEIVSQKQADTRKKAKALWDAVQEKRP